MKIMRGGICIALIAFLSSLGAKAQEREAGVRFRPDPWIGCYELRIAPSDEWKQFYGAAPRRFHLLGKRVFSSYEARALEKQEDWFPLWSPHGDSSEWNSEPFSKSGWRPVSEDAIKVDLVTRSVIYVVTIRRSESGLLGTAQPVLLSDGKPLNSLGAMNVGLTPIACAPFEQIADIH